MKRSILIAVVVVLAAAAAGYYFTQKSADTVDTVDTGGKNYIGNSPDECSRIRFVCAEWLEYFADDKGCGCVSVDR